MNSEPTYKKLKAILKQLETFDQQVEDHIKNELERNEQRKAAESDQPTEGSGESTGVGDQVEP